MSGYEEDLAYIHDAGFGRFARGSAPGLLKLLHRQGISSGLVIDLGCGSGIWARELVDHGYRVLGIDLSPSMIKLARRRVPEAAFQVNSFVDFPMPACQAVTALGEVLNYLFDSKHTQGTLRQLFKNVFDALVPGGLFIFDVAEPGRCKGLTRSFSEGPDWACLVEYYQDPDKHLLTRKIVSFRKVRDTYRRREETHVQQLYPAAALAKTLRTIGFRARQTRRYGDYRLGPRVAALIARKP
jgi:SAM-dependent methyltransferase